MKQDMSKPKSVNQQKSYGYLERLKTSALWLVILMYVLVIVFYFLGINEKYDSTNLNFVLNLIFVVIPSLFIAFIAARSFLRIGNWPVFWMGIGTLSFGLAVLSSYLIRFWVPVNAGLINFPIIAVFAGLFYFLAALFLLINAPPHERGRGRIAILLSANIGVIALVIIVTIISIQNIIQPLFIQATGSTALRQITIIIVALLFLMSGVIIYQQYLKSKFMLYWLALGLLLIFLAISTNLLVISIGTPISWILRAAQLLGGIYLFMAALVILKEAKIKQISAGEALASFFQMRESNINILLNNITDTIIVTDPNFVVIGWNKGAEEIYGRKAEEAIGNTTEFLKTSYLGVSKEDIINQVIEKGKWTGDTEQTTKNGNILSIWTSVSTLKDEYDKIIGFVSVNHDFTERKRAEIALKEAHDTLELKVQERTKVLKDTIAELERSNKELQSFAYITSHDLQEPLRSIASYAQLIQMRYKGQLDQDADEFLDFMVSGASRLQNMIKGLMEYSRVGTKGEEFKDFNAEEALNHALSNLKSSISECHAEVIYSSLPVIHADEGQISRVFQNLIGNALKFRKKGLQPKIHISAKKR